jgi:tRNA A37 threonylcarbamoyladenosine synthetase subunit TsaC/SUA5/YrdC
MPNTNSYRVIKDKQHLLLISRLKWAYTTSANLSNKDYDESFAREVADVIVEPLNAKQISSSIYRLGNINIKRIR